MPARRGQAAALPGPLLLTGAVFLAPGAGTPLPGVVPVPVCFFAPFVVVGAPFVVVGAPFGMMSWTCAFDSPSVSPRLGQPEAVNPDVRVRPQTPVVGVRQHEPAPQTSEAVDRVLARGRRLRWRGSDDRILPKETFLPSAADMVTS